MNDAPDKPILGSAETAKLLRMDRKTLRKHVKAGTCPVAHIPGMKPPKWRTADVVAFTRNGDDA